MEEKYDVVYDGSHEEYLEYLRECAEKNVPLLAFSYEKSRPECVRVDYMNNGLYNHSYFPIVAAKMWRQGLQDILDDYELQDK